MLQPNCSSCDVKTFISSQKEWLLKYLKNWLDTDLKIILFDHQKKNNFI